MAIKDKVLMVSVVVNKPQLTAKDKRGTAAAEDAMQAKSAGKYTKNLYPKHLIDPIIQVENAARQFVQARTRMWMKGVNLMPTSRYMEVAEQLGKYELQFNQTVTAFMNNFANVLSEARETQGLMFDPAAYPDLTELRNEFSFKVRFMPFAEVGEFAQLDGISEDDKRQLQAEMAKQYDAAFAESHKELYTKLFKAVQRIVTQTSKEKGRIYDTLTGDLEELIDILPDLNFMGDQTLDGLLDECRNIAIDPQVLRTSPEARERVSEDAAAILNKMKGFI